jgi:hypothetical protein
MRVEGIIRGFADSFSYVSENTHSHNNYVTNPQYKQKQIRGNLVKGNIRRLP